MPPSTHWPWAELARGRNPIKLRDPWLAPEPDRQIRSTWMSLCISLDPHPRPPTVHFYLSQPITRESPQMRVALLWLFRGQKLAPEAPCPSVRRYQPTTSPILSSPMSTMARSRRPPSPSPPLLLQQQKKASTESMDWHSEQPFPQHVDRRSPAPWPAPAPA